MKKIRIITLAVILGLGSGLTINNVYTKTSAEPVVISTPKLAVQYTQVNPLDVVANPYKFLKRNILIKAKFDKFSTLGLDYEPAMRSSEEYISFLIQRPDVPNHNIPLSELKIFLKKDIAEKNIDLDAGDEVEFSGKVFSTALGDAWMDAENFKVLTPKKPKETAKENQNTENKTQEK